MMMLKAVKDAYKTTNRDTARKFKGIRTCIMLGKFLSPPSFRHC